MAHRRTVILGISCFYHDAAAAVLVDGVVVAAAEEERFSRLKHDSGFPVQAARFCLAQAGLGIGEVDYVVFYDKPLLKLERLIETHFWHWPRGLAAFVVAMRATFGGKLWVEHAVARHLGYQGKVLYAEHHLSHAASAYYASPFDEAAVVTLDGVGEWDTTTIGYGRGRSLTLSHSIHFPHSLGLLYSAITAYLGFRVNDGEYKVMGLAPYGDPERYAPHFRRLIALREDGSFALDGRYFAYEYGLRMFTPALVRLFGFPPRKLGGPLIQEHRDIAAALQKTIEAAVLGIARRAKSLHPEARNLCLAGGVALNCVANGRLLRSGLFDDIYVFPAAGDAGGAVGAAAYVYYAVLGHPRQGSVMPSTALGPKFSDEEVGEALRRSGLDRQEGIRVIRLPDDEALVVETARLLAEDCVVGWFQGRMEFGPRALGHRSILADPRRRENWPRVNRKIKFRESFRPFAPAVLRERADEYFDLQGKASPAMLFTAPVRTDDIPAVTHVDGSARIQTVERADHPLFHSLLSAFDRLTGCPVLINTSFNVADEPIVRTPEEAIRCFLRTDMDDLAIGRWLISKTRLSRTADPEAAGKVPEKEVK